MLMYGVTVSFDHVVSKYTEPLVRSFLFVSSVLVQTTLFDRGQRSFELYTFTKQAPQSHTRPKR